MQSFQKSLLEMLLSNSGFISILRLVYVFFFILNKQTLWSTFIHTQLVFFR